MAVIELDEPPRELQLQYRAWSRGLGGEGEVIKEILIGTVNLLFVPGRNLQSCKIKNLPANKVGGCPKNWVMRRG